MMLLREATDFETHKLDLFCVSSIILLVTSIGCVLVMENWNFRPHRLGFNISAYQQSHCLSYEETSSLSANKIEKLALILKNNLHHMTDTETSNDLPEYRNNSVLIKHCMEMKTVFTNVLGGCNATVFRREDWSSTYLQNISKHLTVCMASHLHSLWCEKLKSHISINHQWGKLKCANSTWKNSCVSNKDTSSRTWCKLVSKYIQFICLVLITCC